MAAPLELRVTRHIAAPPGRVFDAWLDPGLMARVLFATPGGAMQRVDNGFHPVRAGAKAWLEHGLALVLVRDHLPADGAHSDA